MNAPQVFPRDLPTAPKRPVPATEAEIAEAMRKLAKDEGHRAMRRPPDPISDTAERVLRWLRKNPGWHFVRDVAEVAKMDPRGVGSLCTALTKRGLVEQRNHWCDAVKDRRMQMRATESGPTAP